LLNINIKVIPHTEQRFNTTAEWWIDEAGVLQVRVSDLGNLDYIKLHVTHELFEAFACTYNKNASYDVVEAFDTAYEKKREAGGELNSYDEAGFDPDCPYHDEHVAATGVEMLLSTFLRVKWNNYDKRVTEIAKSREEVS
jgi:hypothetical protein